MIFGALAIASELLYYGVILESRGFDWYLALLARCSGTLIGWLGFDIAVAGPELSTNGFAVEIADGCDAIQLSALLTAAVFAFPHRLGHRLRGIFFGLLWLQCLNLARIVTLFAVGPVSPPIFSTLHRIVWPTLLIALTVASWVAWVLWGYRASGDVKALGRAA